MSDQKAHLKAMIGHMIDKNDDSAATEFHAYLATKMRSAMQNVSVATDLDTSDSDNE